MLTWLFQEIERWKTSEGYNDDIGQILGIVGPEETGPDLNTVAPPLDASVVGNIVKLIWGWDGNGAFLDMCELQVDRGTGQGFVLLAYDTTPNYDDTHPFPATLTTWKYRGIYRVGDDQVGLWSAEVSVVVGG